MISLDDLKWIRLEISDAYNLTLNHENIADLEKLYKYPYNPADHKGDRYQDVLKARDMYLKLGEIITTFEHKSKDVMHGTLGIQLRKPGGVMCSDM